VKFSELLGEPEPDPEQPETDPIGVFAPVPAPTPPVPPTPPVASEPPPPPPAVPPVPPVPPAGPAGFSGLAELNVRQPVPEAPTEPSPIGDQLVGLTEVDDDLLPSGRRHRK
jgi:hypothetical protein